MRYLLTTRGRFKKTHMLTGRGSFFVTDCGLRFPRTSPELKQSKVVRVRPLKRGDNGYVWSSWKELGVTSIEELGPQYLTRAEPVTQPHEMSSWPNMPGNRLL